MKMLKNSIKFALIALLVITASCSLDEKWYSEVTPETYFTSKESVEGAFGRPFTHWIWYTQQTRSFYLQEYGTDVFCLPTRGSDWYNAGQFQRRHHHTWNMDDSDFWEGWRGFGMGIAYCLETAEDLGNVDYESLGFEPGVKEDHLAQLKALQAYFYWRGLDFFGGVPIYESNREDAQPRSTDVETFDHIEQLLLEAIPQLKQKESLGAKEKGFIHQATAAALLARLYFNAESYVGKPMFDKAEEISADIISGKYGSYELDDTWYGPHTFTNDVSPEIIWSTPSDPNMQQYEWWYKHFGHYETYKYLNLEGKGNNGGSLTPSLKPDGTPYTFRLGRPFAKFHEDDLRKKPYVYLGNRTYEGMFLVGVQKNPLTGAESKGNREYKDKTLEFVDYYAQASKVGQEGYPATLAEMPSTIATAEENSGIRPMKVPMPNLADIAYRFQPDNPIIRLSEIYYMQAECKMREGTQHDMPGAVELINQVRKRNFEDGVDPDPVTVENLDKYRMLDEWMMEFLQEGEGRRRIDLIRWGLYVTEDWWDHKASNDPSRNRFPIPTKAFDGNNLLEQNPGYSK